LLLDPVGSRIFETIIRKCNDDTYEFLVSKFFLGNLADLALHPSANFAVQRVLERLTRSDDVKAVVNDDIGRGAKDLISMLIS
jgi:hypothetical protein